MKKLHDLISIAVIAGVVLLAAATNWIPGTILTGGDNLHPEFDFLLNLHRNFFGVWQEYQGVGLLGGMGHAADLLRILFLWGLSNIIQITDLRLVWTLLALFIGGMGAYWLFGYFTKTEAGPEVDKKLAGVTVAIYYMLNLGTVQSFYIPFEVFTAHFGFLPWLILVTINYLKNHTWKNWWLMSAVMFVSAPAGIVPTLMLVFWIIEMIIILILSRGKSLMDKLIESGKNFICILMAFLLTNGYWLFSFLYFTLVHSAVNVGARINQMSTEVIHLQNKEFGSLGDVLWMKSFWFSGIEPDLSGVQSHIMQPWINHLSNPVVNLFGWMLISMTILGLILSLTRKKFHIVGIIWIILFIFLAIGTFPFDLINDLLRTNLPLFGQIFRFTFTKFSIAMSLFSSLLLGFSVFWLLRKYGEEFGRIISRVVVSLIFLILIWVVSLPIFQGELFYNRNQLALPNDYREVFNYFKSQPKRFRVANFPQSTFWSWEYTKWGYSGSGFLWYGIEQPILDRAFDPWSSYSENYYSEITQAVYSGDQKLLSSVLNKYQVGYILVDESIIDNFSGKVTYIPELEQMLAKMEDISQPIRFGKILIYHVQLRHPANDFVRSTGKLPLINRYLQTNQDLAYLNLGDYVSTNTRADVYYLFRNLVQTKANAPVDYINEINDSIVFSADVSGQSGDIDFGNWFDEEARTPYKIYQLKNGDKNEIWLQLLMPSVSLDGVSYGVANKYLVYSYLNKEDLFINTSSGENYQINSDGFMSYGFILNNEDFEISIKNSAGNVQNTFMINNHKIRTANNLGRIDITNHKKLEIFIPKLHDPKKGLGENNVDYQITSCDLGRKGDVSGYYDHKRGGFVAVSKNAKGCISLDRPDLWHNQGYVSVINSQNISGLPWLFWVNDDTDDYQPINQYLKQKQTVIVQPPLNDFGIGYAYHFDNLSVGAEASENQLNRFTTYPVPYNWLMNLVTIKPQLVSDKKLNITVQRLNQSLYEIDYPGNPSSSTVILEQGFDKNWMMFDVGQRPSWLHLWFPMIFGKAVGNHLLVNNLVNGWEINLDRPTTLIAVYWPQYLEYFGFGLVVAWMLAGLGLIGGNLSGRIRK